MKKLCKYVPYIVLGISFLLLVVLNICFHDHWLDSDMAAEMIFSKLVAEEGGLISSANWFYSTEFRILYTQLLMVPLFHIFGNVANSFHIIRAITNIITYLLMLASYFYFMKPLKIKKEITIIIASLLLLPFSETMITHMTMGNTYMPHVIIIFFWFGMYFRLTRINGFEIKKPRTIWMYIIFALLSLVCGMSGVRYFMCIFAPVSVAALINLYEKKKQGLRLFIIAVLGSFCGALGYLINISVITKKYTFQTYESTNFITIFNGIFLERVQNTFGKIMDFFGYIPERGLLSARGMITVLAFVMLAIVIYVTATMLKKSEGCDRFITILTVTSFAINVFVFLFTNTTVVARYFIPVFVLWLAVLAFYVQRTDVKKIVMAVFAGCIVITSLKVTYSFISIDKNVELKKVSKFLVENNLTFGYATYWNGNIVTELSNGKIEIANIGNPQEMESFTWSSPAKYYEENYANDKNVFLLLTSEQSDEYADCEMVTTGQKVYDDELYVIYTYSDK